MRVRVRVGVQILQNTKHNKSIAAAGTMCMVYTHAGTESTSLCVRK